MDFIIQKAFNSAYTASTGTFVNKKCPHGVYQGNECPFLNPDNPIACAEEYPYIECEYITTSDNQEIQIYHSYNTIVNNGCFRMVVNDAPTSVAPNFKYKFPVAGKQKVRFYFRNPLIKIPGTYWFYGKEHLTKIHLSDTINEISCTQFLMNCYGLEEFVAPPKLTYLKAEILRNCTALKKIVLGKYISRIQTDAFRETTSLSTLIIYAKNPPVVESNVSQHASDFTIYVPWQSVEKYKKATWWKNYNIKSIKELPEDA